MDDVGAMGGVEEGEYAETQIDEAEPEHEGEQPQRQRERSEAAQVEADAEDVGAGHDREEGEHQTGIDEIGPQRPAETDGTDERCCE